MPSAKPAGMGEDNGPVVLEMLAEVDSGTVAEQQLPQLILADRLMARRRN